MYDVVQVDPVVTAGAYSTLDQVGGLLVFPDTGKNGSIKNAMVIDLAKQDVDYTLFLFDDDPRDPSSGPTAVPADNAVFDIPDAILKNCCAVVPITNAKLSNDSGIIDSGTLDIPYRAHKGTLYGLLMVTGTPTYAATTDVRVKLGIHKDEL
jgi:hypothetical protein